MALAFEDLRILKVCEEICDEIWSHVNKWTHFSKNSMGQQLVRAADSIGANIAEAYGRYHYGEKSQFFYYARGSLFETKYWLKRAKSRSLLPEKVVDSLHERLNQLARQLNNLIRSTKNQRQKRQLRESSITYAVETI